MIRKFAAALSLLALAACATIMQGSSANIGFSSTPSAAKVTDNGKVVGQTPVVAQLARKDNHIVRMELDGYQPYEMTLTRSTSGWVWGNIVFGGLIGLAVDAMTGGMYKLSPEQVQAALAAQNAAPANAQKSGGTASVTKNTQGLYVAVVMHVDPSWQRVGTLTKE